MFWEKNENPSVKFFTPPKYYKNEKNKEKYQKSKLLTNPLKNEPKPIIIFL